jgi:acetyl esterase/lipase
MITPELEAIRALIRETRAAEQQPDMAARRAEMDQFATIFPMPAGVASEDVDIAGRPARWYRPDDGDPERVALYLHGGAYVSGSLDSHRETCARLALESGANVLALDYRLAPEHPLPSAIEDASAACAWLTGDGGFRAVRAIVAGDSAGGGLTMATLLAVRDAGGELPAAAVLLSPWADVACRQPSYTERAQLEPMLQADFLRADAARYIGDADLLDVRANPIDADLSGLPPVLVLVGTDEILYDDSIVLHERLVAAGVDAELIIGEDMFHVWPAFPMLPEAHEAMRAIASFIAKHTS